jgi:hypothetical protein
MLVAERERSGVRGCDKSDKGNTGDKGEEETTHEIRILY